MKKTDQITEEQKADVIGISVQQAQQMAEIQNCAKRQAERQEKMEAWIDPDAMAYRKILNDKTAFESLMAIRTAGFAEEETPMPPESELPPEMRGQQPSTVRAWVRKQSQWRDPEKAAARRKAVEDKTSRKKYLRETYPEMFGIDDSIARSKMADKKIEGIRSNKKITIKDIATGAVIPLSIVRIISKEPEDKYEPGLIAKIMAGFFGKNK